MCVCEWYHDDKYIMIVIMIVSLCTFLFLLDIMPGIYKKKQPAITAVKSPIQ